MYSYAQSVAVQNSRSYSNYSAAPYYYEVSNSSYSEQFATYNNLLIAQFFSQKMQQLEVCKQKANERLLKKSGKQLSQSQANLIDSLILCNYSNKPLVSFYEDKIKVQLDVGKNQYMLDYSINDFDGTVLVGTYKNSEYKVEQVSISKLPEIIRG